MEQDLFLAASYMALFYLLSILMSFIQQRLTAVSVRTLVTFGGNIKQPYPSQVGVGHIADRVTYK